jgi:ElaB/YqjD/DUF883 family membrane-anchored ribosome-binding protein
MSDFTMNDLMDINPMTAPAEEAAQARDEKGRFASSEQSEAEPEAQGTEQTEEADTQTDLAQQVEGLRELVQTLNQQLQQRTATPKREVRKLTTEDEFRLSQDLSVTPTKAMREWFESEMGMTLEDFRANLQAADEAVQSTRAVEAGNRFIANHPEYVNNTANGQRIGNYIAHLGLDPAEPASYEKAYKDLASSKLLETAAPAAKPTTKKNVPGIKSRGGSAAPTVQTQPGVPSPEEIEKMNKMPTEQLLSYVASKINRR